MWFSKKPKPPQLPRGQVSVRMEAIGGQGANSAGKILAEAAVLGMHYTGNHFSSFGSEKRGSPVRSFVRFSTEKKPVRSASSISNPDLLVIFHEAMLATHPECTAGTTDQTDIIINTPLSPDAISFPRGTLARTIYTIDASKIAASRQCGLNVVMLGACSLALPEISENEILEALTRFFSKLSAPAREQNRSGFASAQKSTSHRAFAPSQCRLPAATTALPRLGWANAPKGGMISNPGNTVLKDNSVSRKGVIPRFNSDLCCNCGFCDMVCPDYCFVWEKGAEPDSPPTLKGIDYQYCKACQKCISICPVDALAPILETELTARENQIKLFPKATASSIEERWRGANWTETTRREELLDPKTYIKPDFSKIKPPGKPTP